MTDDWAGAMEQTWVLGAFGLALVVLGLAWGRWRAVPIVAAIWLVTCIASDALYFIFGLNLAGYCGEPRCDPGPIPMTFSLVYWPAALPLVALGVLVRKRVGAAHGRSRSRGVGRSSEPAGR